MAKHIMTHIKTLKSLPKIRKGSILGYDELTDAYIRMEKDGSVSGYPRTVVEDCPGFFRELTEKDNIQTEAWWGEE